MKKKKLNSTKPLVKSLVELSKVRDILAEELERLEELIKDTENKIKQMEEVSE